MTTNPVEWCGASTRGYGPMPIGPCVLRHGHDGPLHRDESGVSWTDPRPASESSEPMCSPALRDRLAKALRGKYDSSDSRPSYRAADAVLPVVQAALAEQQHIAESLDVANDNLRALLTEQRQRAQDAVRQRDGFFTDLTKAERTLACIAQMCRTALIPPISQGEAVLARRILARIEQPEGT